MILCGIFLTQGSSVMLWRHLKQTPTLDLFKNCSSFFLKQSQNFQVNSPILVKQTNRCYIFGSLDSRYGRILLNCIEDMNNKILFNSHL
jgi:hypothetical protein